MSSKKKQQLSKYCRIFQWVEAQDADFAQAIRDLCLEGALSPGGRSSGVTFLYPKEKVYRKEIIDATYADADEAEKLVQSLIVPDALVASADFNRRPNGSRLGVKYAVESADSSKVKLAGGVELALAEDFHPMSRRAGDIAVWIVTKGRLPLTGDAYKAPSGERKDKQGGARVARGGAVDGTLNDRQVLAATVEGDFDRCMRADRCHTHNPYLGKVVSLLNFLKARAPETLATVLPLLDYDPVVCFYLLVEPYKSTGEFLIQDALLFGDGGWNGADAYGSAVKEFEAFFAMKPAGDSQAYVFRDRAAAAAQIDKVRQSIGSTQSGRQGPQLVQEAYAAFVSQNAVQGMGPILPDATIRALGGAKKLWQDEFRFVVHAALEEMRAAPYSTDTFASIVRDLRTRRQGNNYAAELELVDLKSNVAPRDALLALMKFVNSTDFLYIPAPADSVGAAWGSMDPTDWEVYNRNAAALASLRRVSGMVRSSGLSPQAMQELQIYAKTYGSLPPEVLALAAK